MKKFFIYSGCISLLLAQCITAIDNPHFWRATNFLPDFYQPRLAWPWLSTAEVTVGYGATTHGRNEGGHKTKLLEIYGPTNAQSLGIGIPGKDFTNQGDITLTQLALLPFNDGFAKLAFDGKFSLVESNLSISQNISCGFFLQAHLPVRRIKISDITYCDLSPTDCTNGPNRATPVWQNFLRQFSSILQKYGVSIQPISHTGIGDLSLLAGWTQNYEETQEIDFFDTTFRAGVLCPTGKRKNEALAFDIANGYDGHFAIPLSFDMAVGWYDWFTLGGHIGGMAFFPATRDVRLKTDCMQTGFIKLAHGDARIEPGSIFEFNAYAAADHVICGLSLLAGYSLAYQNRTMVQPCDPRFATSFVSEDGQFLGWKMQTFNFIIDWDFATRECPWYGHVGAFCNIVMGGHGIFNTSMGGLEAGFNIAYNF